MQQTVGHIFNPARGRWSRRAKGLPDLTSLLNMSRGRLMEPHPGYTTKVTDPEQMILLTAFATLPTNNFSIADCHARARARCQHVDLILVYERKTAHGPWYLACRCGLAHE